MSGTPTYPTVREVERAFLRKAWWLFPVCGALASLAAGGPFWAWVSGMTPVWARSPLLGSRPGWWALAGLAIPAVWRWGMQFKRTRIWIPLAVAGTVLVAEGLVRTPFVQGPLWLAARARLDADQHFMREVCYVRLEEAADRGEAVPAVVLVGSSQMLCGVDPRLLGASQPLPVIRRAMFGMTPLKALAMRTYIPFRPGDICVQYLSEFDFTNQEEFPFAWFRPYASWRTFPDVMRCISWRVKIRHWRQGVDYALAATTEWWRARDFLGWIVFHCCGGHVHAEEVAVPDLAATVAKARGGLNFSEAEWNGFRRFAKGLTAQQVSLLVFEGEVHPALDSGERTQAKSRTRRMLSDFLASGHGRYVSVEAQGVALNVGDWADMTHLNAEGRERLTRRIAQELSRP